VKADPAGAELTPRQRALVDFAIKLTREPEAARHEDLAPLRDRGLTDEDILMLVHVIGYFNHSNRIADALGVDLEENMPPA